MPSPFSISLNREVVLELTNTNLFVRGRHETGEKIHNGQGLQAYLLPSIIISLVLIKAIPPLE